MARIFALLVYTSFVLSAIASVVGVFLGSGFFNLISLIPTIFTFALFHWVIFPAAKRIYLRFRKSGMYVKLIGTGDGSLIFADRTRFTALAALARQITQYKRELDKEAR